VLNLSLTSSAGWVMVEVSPGLFIAPKHVSIIREHNIGPPVRIGKDTQLVMDSGYCLTVKDMTPKEVAVKLHFITEWTHPPGQRPPER
jgi:hypothetical protein